MINWFGRMWALGWVALATTVGISVAAQEGPDFDAVQFRTTDLGDGVHLLQGMGGNIAVSTGVDGTLVVDDDFVQLSQKLEAAIQTVATSPIRYVLNTHWHSDHAGGNAALNTDAAIILAHDNVRVRLLGAGETDGLPELTFSDTATLHFNGHEIVVLHVHAAHTDGDAIVRFKNLDLIHAGDLLFNGMYPFIDLASGGSVDGYISALQQLIEMSDAQTRIIPGHGPMASREDLLRTVDMLTSAQAAVAELVAQGMSLQEVQRVDPLAAYHQRYSWFFINGARFTEILYSDAARSES